MAEAPQRGSDTHAPHTEATNSLLGRLCRSYQPLPVQRAVALLVLLAGAALEYRLVNMPITNLSQTTKFSPVTAKAAEQVVSFKNPESDQGSFAFAYEQTADSRKQRMIVDAYFDNAVLSEETIRTLMSLGTHPPPEAAPITYLTSEDKDSKCNTAVHVEMTRAGAQDYFVQFAQSQLAASDRHRLLEVKSNGLDSAVALSSQATFDRNALSVCKITLRVGQSQYQTLGFVPITLRVPAESGYRILWEASDIQPSGFPTGGPALPLITFGHRGLQSFHADQVAVFPAQASREATAPEGLVAKGEHRDAPLTVDSFLIGTDHLQLTVSGKARAWEDGRPIPFDLIEVINKYPLIAALLAAANLGLLNWAKRKFFPPARAVPAPVVSLSGEETEGKEPEPPNKAAG